MVNTLVRLFRRWPAVEAFLMRLLGRFTTWPVDDFDRSFRPPAPMSIPPAEFEMSFMKLHAEGRFDEMWEMIAEDAQRAWGGREMFIHDMPRLGDDTELLDVQVLNVEVLESWTDSRHGRTYGNVAQMVLRYRVRQHWKDWTLDREVHLIPAAGGWRTLFYPTKTKSGAGSR
jgi:hypothetical protein